MQPLNKPRIAIITPSLGLGGAEQWIRMLVTYCTDFDWVVGVLADSPRHDIIADAVAAHACELHGPAGVHRMVIPHNSVRETTAATVHDVDAVIVWGGGDYWPLPTTAPIVFVGHGTCQWTADATREAAAGGATHFVAVSENVGANLRTVVSNVDVIMNGVDTARLQPPADRRAVREAWKPWNYDYAKYVGYIGRLGNEKILIRLFTLLRHCRSTTTWF